MPPKTSWKDRYKEKIKLSNDEKAILSNLKWKNKKPLKIGKDEKTGIYILFENNIHSYYFFNTFYGHLFQSIKVGEEYKISDLLEE